MLEHRSIYVASSEEKLVDVDSLAGLLAQSKLQLANTMAPRDFSPTVDADEPDDEEDAQRGQCVLQCAPDLYQ